MERVCHICGTTTSEWCPTCLENFEHRKPAEEMTHEERVAELRLLGGPLEIPMDKLHERLEELFGRPVWTHELARYSAMVDEFERSGKASLVSVEEVAPDAEVIAVVPY